MRTWRSDLETVQGLMLIERRTAEAYSVDLPFAHVLRNLATESHFEDVVLNRFGSRDLERNHGGSTALTAGDDFG